MSRQRGNHQMGPVHLNHGNLQCRLCLATDLEIDFALGSVCLKAPSTKIWKIQRPLVSTESMTAILIYDKDRTAEGQVEVGQEWIDKYFGEEFKFYVRGYQQANGQLIFEANGILPKNEWPEW